MYASRVYRKEVKCMIAETIEVKTPVALGIFVIFVFPSAMYLSRGYRKEVISLICRTSGQTKPISTTLK